MSFPAAVVVRDLRKDFSRRQGFGRRRRAALKGLTFTVEDEPGFWEAAGYHNHGDPWREQRYWND